MRECGKAYAVFLISEMTPAKMAMLKGADAFAQTRCPRLSIDWGEDFQKPVLTPYEAEVALGGRSRGGSCPARRRARRTPCPMDYYSVRGGRGPARTSSRRRARSPAEAPRDAEPSPKDENRCEL